MADRFPLLTDDEANALWRSTLGAPYQGRKLAFQLIRATEDAARAPLLAEIERLERELEITRDSASKSASLVDASILVKKANAWILAKERDARRAAQEQVEKLQAEVARLEPMRQRADELDALHNNLHITQTALTLAQAERDAALSALRRTIRTHLVDDEAWDHEAETNRRVALALKEPTNG